MLELEKKFLNKCTGYQNLGFFSPFFFYSLSISNDFFSFFTEVDSLYDADFVGNIEGIVVPREPNVRLLQTAWSVEGVDLCNINVVKFLNRCLDLIFVGHCVNDEDESVIVLDLLHRRFGRQWVFDDIYGIHTVKGKEKIIIEKIIRGISQI